MTNFIDIRKVLVICGLIAASMVSALAASCEKLPDPPFTLTPPTCTSPLPTLPSPSPDRLYLPAVSIISPADGSVINTDEVTVAVKLTNFNGPSVFSGYIYYYMDVDAPIAPFRPAATAPGTYAATTDNSYTWTNLSPGMHTFSVQLVKKDGSPFIPSTLERITVQVVPEDEIQ